jgi:hypothetical protein
MNAPESIADIRKLLKNPALFHEEAFINGTWVKASGNARFSVQNPASGQKIASVANLNLLPIWLYRHGEAKLRKSALSSCANGSS